MIIDKLSNCIMGTTVNQYVCHSVKFPGLSVTLYSAPQSPENIIAFSYLECLEDRKYFTPNQISSEEAKKYTEWCLKGGHTPSLEALLLLFNIRGMSKVVSHQIVRHRIGVSIDQRTQRANSAEYLGNIFDNEHYVTPTSIRKLLDNKQMLQRAYDSYYATAQLLYNELIKYGISEDDARYHIPQASTTSMNFKVIYKALLDSVCSTRLCTIMQGELVEIVTMMAELTKLYNPLLGSYLKPVCMKYGKCNRNENNPTDEHPKGVCHYTIDGTIPCREKDNTMDLTKFSRDATK